MDPLIPENLKNLKIRFWACSRCTGCDDAFVTWRGDVATCTKCGRRSDMINCSKCGAHLMQADDDCPRCELDNKK